MPQNNQDTPKENAAIMAAYTNLARHNLSIVLNDIALKMGLRTMDHDDGGLKGHCILKVLDDRKKTTEAFKIIQNLEKSFPFIVSLSRHLIDFPDPKTSVECAPKSVQGDAKPSQKKSEKQTQTMEPQDCKNLLLTLIGTLNDLRNNYSHEGGKVPSGSPALARLLAQIYDLARHTIKRRHSYGKEILTHLDRLTCNRKTKKIELNPACHYQPIDKDKAWTACGRYLFCCLFLSKQEGYEFLRQISGFKRDDSDAQKATLKLFTCFHLRMPSARLNVRSTDQTVALDMLSELARCPRPLYEHLPADIKEGYAATVSGNAVDDSDDNTFPFIRNQERFAPLVMRYLDQTNALKNLRFAVDLGDFYFAAYPKTLYADDEAMRTEEVRRLKKKVIRYARVNELENTEVIKLPQTWQALVLKEGQRMRAEVGDASPYIVPTTPHYHLPEDNIALMNVSDARNAGADWYPDIQPDQADPDRYEPPRNYQPHYYLSPYELWQLAFYQWLCGKHKIGLPDAEALILQYSGAMGKVYKAIEAGVLVAGCATSNKELDGLLAEKYAYFFVDGERLGVIRSRDLPEALRRYLLGLPFEHDSVGYALTKQIADTQKHLTDLEQHIQPESRVNRNRPGEKDQRAIRAGRLATYLARDMLRLQPCQSQANPGKANSLQYSKLQACLAFYGRDKAQLPVIYRSMALIESGYVHPFLQAVHDKTCADKTLGVIGFYRVYLKEREKYLQKIQRDKNKNPNAYQVPQWLRVKAVPQGKDAIVAHISQIKNETLNLPRGLFLAPMKTLMCQLTNYPALKIAIEQSERVNSSYLLQLYYQHVLQDACPKVYEQKRHYKSIDKAFELKDKLVNTRYLYADEAEQRHVIKLNAWRENGTDADGRQIRYNAMRSIEKNEKEVRQIRTQDQALFLFMQELLGLEGEHSNAALKKLRLEDVSKETLSQQIPVYSLVVEGGTIYTHNILLKNVGSFRRLLKDRRLPGLLPYLHQGADSLDWQELKQELEAYQHQRLRAFGLLLQFERDAVQRYGLPENVKKSNQHQSLLNHVFNAQVEQGQICQSQADIDKACMLVIRNAFCHNQYPNEEDKRTQEKYPEALRMLENAQTAWRQGGVDGDKRPSVAAYFVNQLELLYQKTLPATKRKST